MVQALLVDEHNAAVKGREVPLKVTLCYDGEDHMEVKNQSILKFPSETTLNRVGSDGTVELRLRIEEVSKNHQKQAFVIKIAPDGSPANFDIAADISTPVTVLSKRNKRRKKGEVGEHLSPLLMGQAGPINGLTSPMSQLASTAIPSSSSSLMFSDARGLGALGSAINNVAAWCQYVHRGLKSLEWQHVGFEITQGGEIHLGRPLHRCPSCWVYKDSIRPTSHNERCMLFQAQTKWHQEVAGHVQQLLDVASGSVQASQAGTGPLQVSEARDNGRRSLAVDEEEDSVGGSESDSDVDAPLAHTSLPNNGSFALSVHDLPALPAAALSAVVASSDELPPVGIVPSFNPLGSTHSHSHHSQSHHSQHSHRSHPTASSFSHYPPAASSTSFAITPYPTNTPTTTSFHHSSPSFSSEQQPMGYDIDSSSSVPPSSGSAESLIVALHAVRASYGIPAFSAEQRLLGFYVEQEGAHYFYSINLYVGPLYADIKEDVQEMTRKYIEAVAMGSKDVHWKKPYVQLTRTVEDASLYIYEHSKSDHML